MIKSYWTGILLLIIGAISITCNDQSSQSSTENENVDTDSNGDADTDADTDSDSDTDADSDSDTDTDSNVDTDSDTELLDDTDTPINSQLTYAQEQGNSWHYVGNDIYKDSYRGIYWIGETKRIDKVDIRLNYDGDISGITYEMTVWDVDIDMDLQLSTLLATSKPVSGSEVSPVNEIEGDWVTFEFDTPVILTTGKTVVLIARTDPETDDTANHLKISNFYDEQDEENHQANVHYGADRILKGRGPGDEDQPEPFAVDIRLYGEDFSISSENEYPAQPINLEYTPGLAPGEVDLIWEDKNVAVQIQSYRIYQYNDSNAELTLMGTTGDTSYTLTGLTSGMSYFFVVSGISISGNESYHSLTPEDSDFSPVAVTAP